MSAQPATARRQVMLVESPWSGRVAAICSGESPRASPSRIASSFAATESSVSSMPRLDSDSSASAAAWAMRAL